MEEKLLRDYARLLAGKGVNVEKNDEVWILAELDQPQFVRMVVEECYKLGAKRVRVEWSDNECNKAGLKYMKVGELSKVPSYSIARYKYMIKHNPSMLYIVSDDPDAMKGVNQNKVFKSSVKTRKKIKPYRDQMDGKYKWCIED